jgi:hypothetical protein
MRTGAVAQDSGLIAAVIEPRIHRSGIAVETDSVRARARGRNNEARHDPARTCD